MRVIFTPCSYGSISNMDNVFEHQQEEKKVFRPWLDNKSGSNSKSFYIRDIIENSPETAESNLNCCNSNHSDNSSECTPPPPTIPYNIPCNQYTCPTLPQTSLYSLDQFAISVVGHEYARVIAEEAHFKAINSRKERPKKFKCPHCDVAFSNNGQLKGHIRIHTGERPFKCDNESCGKTFTRNEELTRHKRIHTGVKPYGCTVCGKKFGRRDHLKKHVKTHQPYDAGLEQSIVWPLYSYGYCY